MDKDITTTAKEGVYVVYLFSEDMERVYLTLNQGVSDSEKEEQETTKNNVRRKLKLSKLNTDDNIELTEESNVKGAKYEYSTIGYICYKAEDIRNENISEEKLKEDLFLLLDYYREYKQKIFKSPSQKDKDKTTTYWKLSPGKGGSQWENFCDNDYIAIGWNKIDYNQGELEEQIEKKYPSENTNHVKKRFEYFIEDMSIGDIVVIYGEGEILNIAEVTGDWKPVSEEGHYKNRRDVNWLLDKPIDARKYGEDFYSKISHTFPNIRINETEFINIIENQILSFEAESSVTEAEIPKINFDINLKQEVKQEELYFKDRERLFQRITTSLKNGKHVIFTEPPGTGKLKLAKKVVESYVGKKYEMVTATSDWSTFDTIGGYKPDKEGKFNFSDGVFLECFKDEENDPRNFWLVIDEINRADIDKAFGSLFSALTGDPITLNFKSENGKNIRIKPEKEDEKIITSEHTYVIPKHWRIVVTMNTFDKTSLYEMSYAFMRRFAFVPVSVPKSIDENLLEEYLKCWEIEKEVVNLSQIAELWRKINDVRKIGPAIIKDIIEYLKYKENEEDYASAIITFVLPQFEGKRREELRTFKNELAELDSVSDEDMKEIWEFSQDYFQLESD